MTWDVYKSDPLGFDTNAEAFKEQSKDAYTYCVQLAKIFKSEEGQAVLKKWREMTIESATWMPSIALNHSIEAAQAHAFAREGQNAFVRQIEESIEIANKCKTLDDYQNLLT